jgi:hypothetical protein
VNLLSILLLQHVHGDGVFVASAKSLSDHHLAGAMVILLGILWYLEHSKSASRYRFLRYLWPLPLLAVACYLFFFSDTAEPWGLWFFHLDWAHSELEHKFMEGAAILIALIELSLRTGWLKSRAWRHITTGLMFFAGLLLLFHHGNHSEAVHTQHDEMGSEVLALGIAKLIADLQKKNGWAARFAVPLLFVVTGLQLIFYFE